MPEFEESEGFKLKSGNKSSFKNMGSSPADLNIGEIFKNVHGALTGTEGKEFKDTKFGQALTRGKKQIQANISDDVKGNLFENVGKSVFTPNAKADNATEDDVNENIIAPQTDEPSTGTYEVQKGDNLTRIARANNMTLNELLEKNPDYKQNPNMVRRGATLNL